MTTATANEVDLPLLNKFIDGMLGVSFTLTDIYFTARNERKFKALDVPASELKAAVMATKRVYVRNLPANDFEFTFK